MSGIHHLDLRLKIIRPTLTNLNMWSESAENILIGTVAVESNLGYRLRQVAGPALGIYQIEPATHEDLWENYLNFRLKMKEKINRMRHGVDEGALYHEQLVYDMRYATAIARLIYWRVPEPLPQAHDIEGLAHYWKKYYNTHLGKGKIDDFINKYPKHTEASVSI